MEENKYSKRAGELFRKGYNCAQAIACTYCDLVGMDEETMFKVAEGLGLGVGCMEGTCGAVTGACLLAGCKNSTGNLDKPNSKASTYKLSREIMQKFKEKNSGFEFIYFNLHMDHIGVQARSESAKLILQKVKEQPSHIPVILSGDFNVDQTNESYALLNNSGVMRDAYEMADLRYAPNGTFNGFHPDRMTTSRIDHIFLSDDFQVLKYGILTDTYRTPVKESAEKEKNGNFPKEVSMQKYEARMPSDHFPVVAKIKV